MTILCLDLATRTGWAIATRPYVTNPSPLDISAGAAPVQRSSGCRNLSTEVNHARRFAAFHRWLVRMLDENPIETIVFEAALPQHKGAKAAQLALGLVAITEMTAVEHELDVFQVKATSIKKYATGKGSWPKGQSKQRMMQAGRDAGWSFSDDNECDALWLADYACCVLGRRDGQSVDGRRDSPTS